MLNEQEKKQKIRPLEDLKNEFIEKDAVLCDVCGCNVAPYRFYRDMYPEGILQDAYRVNENARFDGKPTAIVNAVEHNEDGKIARVNYNITDDLTKLATFEKKVAFIPACSFVGRHKNNSNLAYVHAFVVDLDYVGKQQIKDLFHHFEIKYIPTPTYIVNSGTGLHLYYILDSPLKYHERQYDGLRGIKDALIDLCWNQFTSKVEKRQYSGLVQPYRVIGSRTKLDVDKQTQEVISTDYTVAAFRCGDRLSLDDILSFKPSVDIGQRYSKDIEKALLLLNPEQDPNHINLEKAAQLWPAWYQERVIEKKPAKTKENKQWNVPPAVYRWFYNLISEKATEGHRYYCIMCLAIYALKCPKISYKQLKEDAYSLLVKFDSLTTDETNHFLKSDIEAALTIYNKKEYTNTSVKRISYFTGINIEPSIKRREKGKRLKQPVHLETARAIRDVRQKTNGTTWQNEYGAPIKREQVWNWQEHNPDGSKYQCAKETGLSRTTVTKWWDDNLGGHVWRGEPKKDV